MIENYRIIEGKVNHFECYDTYTYIITADGSPMIDTNLEIIEYFKDIELKYKNKDGYYRFNNNTKTLHRTIYEITKKVQLNYNVDELEVDHLNSNKRDVRMQNLDCVYLKIHRRKIKVIDRIRYPYGLNIGKNHNTNKYQLVLFFCGDIYDNHQIGYFEYNDYKLLVDDLAVYGIRKPITNIKLINTARKGNCTRHLIGQFSKNYYETLMAINNVPRKFNPSYKLNLGLKLDFDIYDNPKDLIVFYKS